MSKRVSGFIVLTLCIVAAASLSVFLLSRYIASELPDHFKTTQDELTIANMPYVTTKATEPDAVAVASDDVTSYNMELTLLGTIPLKTVRVEHVEPQWVSVLGDAFGIKIFSDGVMIVGFSDIPSSTGYKNPAKTAGLQMGDVILTIGGTQMVDNSDVNTAINSSKGEPVAVTYTREGEERQCILTAVRDTSTGNYRSGMWVRDSSAGIGTLTYADNETGTFAGLGHPVSDSDTGQTIQVLEGEVSPVKITGAEPGTAGQAGVLRGEFLQEAPFGAILHNDYTGVYGRLTQELYGLNMYTATPAEVVTGPATIMSTVSEDGPNPYKIEIERIFLATDNFTKNMLIRVTDKELLSITGGIVQGMSGSPIIQNGKLVGAVTHVLVDDPTKGYGIFIENMLESAESIDN